MKRIITILCAVFIFTEISFAETSFYDSGNLSFDYQQSPSGPFSGTYEVEGEIDTTYVWPDTLEGVGAFVEVNNDTTEINLFAPRVNPDTTLDVFAFHIKTEGGFVPGTYSVSPDMSTLFGFVWKADSLIIPDNPDSLNIIDLISSIQAEYIFISITGSIVITEVTDSSFSGTFSGLALDSNASMLITISNGIFLTRLASINVNVDDNYQTVPGVSIENYPNPFSGSTTFKFALKGPAPVKLFVYNLKGQRVATVLDEEMTTGSYEIPWPSTNERSSLANGIYFYRLEVGERAFVKKMVYLK